ncbi:MAG: hypothetical protein KDK72_05855 [Chlamydiia bacterium]|nr:hypothetical protein [Chlamydiia bacterium]
MERFYRDLQIGDIHIRDQFQFELKSEFFPRHEEARGIYTQEFYLFIPNSLQVNRDTYSKKQFYRDQTNFIRYKTPEFTFSGLIDPRNPLSPLNRMQVMRGRIKDPKAVEKVEDELKLLGNIVRSALRKQAAEIIAILEGAEPENVLPIIHRLHEEVQLFLHNFNDVMLDYLEKSDVISLKTHFHYVDEFISNAISYYATGILYTLRKQDRKSFAAADRELCSLIIEEKENNSENILGVDNPKDKEYFFYKQGLLNKFILDALLLNTRRTSSERHLRELIGSFAAGIAMLFFFALFVWQGEHVTRTSELFIIGTVVLYIIKDRIKENIRNVSYKHAFKWFPDFTTVIRSPDGKTVLGKLVESFSFITAKALPKEIKKVRNREFHYVLEDFQRPENVIYHKKSVRMYPESGEDSSRRYGLNIITRFSIYHFLEKADDPVQQFLTIDNTNHHFLDYILPKVYHLNIIMKSSFRNEAGKLEVEIKKFRLIIDKNGIRRIEPIREA